MLDQSVANTAKDARRKSTTAMWDRKKNNPIDSGLMLKKEVLQN